MTPALYLVFALITVFCLGTFLFVLATAPKNKDRDQ
jgi:hypothetical protein